MLIFTLFRWKESMHDPVLIMHASFLPALCGKFHTGSSCCCLRTAPTATASYSTQMKTGIYAPIMIIGVAQSSATTIMDVSVA